MNFIANFFIFTDYRVNFFKGGLYDVHVYFKFQCQKARESCLR